MTNITHNRISQKWIIKVKTACALVRITYLAYTRSKIFNLHMYEIGLVRVEASRDTEVERSTTRKLCNGNRVLCVARQLSSQRHSLMF